MLAMIVGVTAIHADRFKNVKPITWTFHIFWSIPFAALIAYIYFHYKVHDWYLIGALLLERLSCYNIILNKIRNEAFFYIGAQSKTEAWTDRIIELWKNAYPIVWVSSTVCWIAINVMRAIKFI